LKTYKLIIEPKSPFVTPLHSDTIFGHLAWAIVYDQGEKRLQEVLDEFQSGKPPFLLSAAFPEDTLPVPILPPLSQKETAKLVAQRPGNDSVVARRRLIEEIKKTKNVEHISMDDFKDLAAELSTVKLTQLLLAKPGLEPSKKEVIMRTAVDRITGTAKEGKLFDLEETFYGYKNQDEFRPVRLSIWFRLRDDSWKSEIYRRFKIMEGSGFGKRKSTGLGQFQIVSDIVEAELPSVADPNAFVTLSSYVPQVDDPSHGYYRYIVKRGKLGGHWALAGKVWKAPLLMFTQGSIFYTNGGPADYYGGLVHVLDRDESQIFQYAYAFPLGVRVSQPGEEV
jgi:CRISPR-associated protein Csm4